MQQFLTACRAFLMQNWTFIVCVALGVLLYHVLERGIRFLLVLGAVGLVLAVLTHLGILPPLDQILTWLGGLFK